MLLQEILNYMILQGKYGEIEEERKLKLRLTTKHQHTNNKGTLLLTTF